MILTFGLRGGWTYQFNLYIVTHTQTNWPIEVGTPPKKDIGPIVRKADA